MINHVRTLLLNDTQSNVSNDDILHEYVPKDATTVSDLPSWIQSIRNVLFGINYDRAGINYRLRQFAPILHAPEIEAFTLLRDTRITYWPPHSLTDFEIIHTPAVVVPSGKASVTFVIPDNNLLETDDGYLDVRWNIYIQNTVPTTLNTAQAMYVNLNDFSGKISNPINVPALPRVQILINGSATDGEVWSGSVIKKPKTNMALLPSKLDPLLNLEIKQKLFGFEDDGFYSQFRDWWENSKQLHYRLGGVLLALAYRMEELK